MAPLAARKATTQTSPFNAAGDKEVGIDESLRPRP